jgi:hypothetical protein
MLRLLCFLYFSSLSLPWLRLTLVTSSLPRLLSSHCSVILNSDPLFPQGLFLEPRTPYPRIPREPLVPSDPCVTRDLFTSSLVSRPPRSLHLVPAQGPRLHTPVTSLPRLMAPQNSQNQWTPKVQLTSAYVCITDAIDQNHRFEAQLLSAIGTSKQVPKPPDPSVNAT